jgi:DNA-binding response OmpR family regulator
MRHILLAEDDFDYGSILKQYLEISGFKVTWAKDGSEALEVLEVADPDICVLDVMMPKMDGFTLAENIIASDPGIPFIFLTAKGLREDKIKGLMLGADDYVVKPFEVEELILRITNILKRSKQFSAVEQVNDQTVIGSYIFDMAGYTLVHANVTYQVTEREALLIRYLYDNRNRLIKREEILTEIWGSDDFFSGRSMDVFISRLRKYFNQDPAISISGIRSRGLKFNVK